MAENSKPTNGSNINKEFLQDILTAIGGGKLPRKPKQPAERKAAAKVDPYLTLGKNVHPQLLEKIEELYKTAYRLPCDLSSPLHPRPRTRGNFRSLHTYRSRMDIYKLERLFVPDDIKLPGKSITEDIDPEYYSVVGGRPVKETGTLAEHKWAVKSTVLTRLNAARVEELMGEMDREQARGWEEYERAETQLVRYSQLFDQFLEQDHLTSAALLSRADAVTKETQRMEELKKRLDKELEAVRSRVVLLEEEWRECKKHQQFLYSVAPLQWRRLHDYIHMKEGGIDPTEASIFKRIRGASLTAKDEISSKISRFLGETRTCAAPALYFTEPQQLYSMFQELEERNLSSLVQCEKLQPAVLTMHQAKMQADAEFEKEISAIKEDVLELRVQVEKEEAQAKALELEVKKACEEHLHPLLTNRKTISLTASMEHAYEMVVGPLDNKLGLVEMMRAIETAHEALLVRLDLMPADLVTRVTAAWVRDNARHMNEAKRAANKVHQMEMLSKRFLSSLKPWKRHPTRRPVSRSEPPPERRVRKIPPAGLTQEQMENQIFFGVSKKDDTIRDNLFRPMC